LISHHHQYCIRDGE